VPPLGDGGRRPVARLQYQRLYSALEQVRGGGEPCGPAPITTTAVRSSQFLPFTFLDASTMLDASRKVNRQVGSSHADTGTALLGGGLPACCSPLTGGALDEEAAERIARVFRALGDRHRSGCCR